MKKRFNSLIGLISGIALAVVSYFIRDYTEYFYIPLIIGAVFALLCILALLGELNSNGRDKPPQGTGEVPKEPPKYVRKSTVMSRSEASFFAVLNGLFGEKYLVLPQIALVNVIDKLTQNSYRNELFRVADFCIVHKDTFAPLVLVELNDTSHNRPDRMERDKKVNEICASAGMPLVTIKTCDASDVKEVYKSISKKMLKK